MRDQTACRTSISIHAPVKGATLPSGHVKLGGRYFNPRSREGSDWDERDWERIDARFQSTLP